MLRFSETFPSTEVARHSLHLEGWNPHELYLQLESHHSSLWTLWTQEAAAWFADYLSDTCPNISLTEAIVIQPDSEDFNWERVVNDINSRNAGVVISLLDVSHNKDLMTDYKNQLSIEVFWGIGNHYERLERSSGFFGGIRKAILKKFIYRRANKYTEE